MKRFVAYVVFVTVVGVLAALWFAATNQVEPSGSGEDYGILQMATAVLAMSGAVVACLLMEGMVRLARARQATR